MMMKRVDDGCYVCKKINNKKIDILMKYSVK